jgi:transketolase
LLYNINAVTTPSDANKSSSQSPAENAGVFVSHEDLARVARRIRRHIITIIGNAGSGHPGGSLSAVDIVTTLYWKVMRHKPADPHWADRDRFILSKGHAAPMLYAVLAECGYLPVSELTTLRQMDSRLQGHADRTATPGVEMSSGSLGQGLSFAIGVALAGNLDHRDYRTYVLLGDGECNEGQVWEAAMAAAHFRLDNLVAIVDHNGLQIDGPTCEVMNTDPLDKKWEAFGWHVIEVDGHNFARLYQAFKKAGTVKGHPTVIIAATVKGKGVSFMENAVGFHGKAPNKEETAMALKELA